MQLSITFTIRKRTVGDKIYVDSPELRGFHCYYESDEQVRRLLEHHVRAMIARP